MNSLNVYNLFSFVINFISLLSNIILLILTKRANAAYLSGYKYILYGTALTGICCAVALQSSNFLLAVDEVGLVGFSISYHLPGKIGQLWPILIGCSIAIYIPLIFVSFLFRYLQICKSDENKPYRVARISLLAFILSTIILQSLIIINVYLQTKMPESTKIKLEETFMEKYGVNISGHIYIGFTVESLRRTYLANEPEVQHLYAIMWSVGIICLLSSALVTIIIYMSYKLIKFIKIKITDLENRNKYSDVAYLLAIQIIPSIFCLILPTIIDFFFPVLGISVSGFFSFVPSAILLSKPTVNAFVLIFCIKDLRRQILVKRSVYVDLKSFTTTSD